MKKHATDAAKDKQYKLRHLTKQITNHFSRINIPDNTNAAIRASLNDLARKLISQETILNSVHMALIFNQLSALPTNNPDVYGEFLQLIVEKTNFLLVGKWTKHSFDLPELIQILCALPKFILEGEERNTLILTVLNYLIEIYKTTRPAEKDSAAILDAMAKLGIDLLHYTNLIKVLLRPFNQKLTSKLDPFAKTEILTLATLWPFLVLANNLFPTSKTISNLFVAIDTTLKTRERESPTPSAFQEAVSSLTCKLVKETYRANTQIEYWVGTYPLDLAFLDLKLDIEPDGPFHYHGKELIPLNQFRDKILNLCGWTIIRIPYFEWEILSSMDKQIDYLRRKLSNQPSLLDDNNNQSVSNDSETARQRFP